MSHAHNHSHSHGHSHEHPHAHAHAHAHAAPEPSWSLLRLSAPGRIGMACGLLVLLWLAVLAVMV